MSDKPVTTFVNGGADLVSSPSDSGATSELPAPQVLQPGSYQQGQSYVGLGVQFVNAEAELIKKLQPEHITLEMTQQHQRAMRKLDNEVKELDALREDRDRNSRERNTSDKRMLTAFYVVFGAIFSVVMILVLRRDYKEAVTVGGGVSALAMLVAGGMGLERIRQDRKKQFDP